MEKFIAIEELPNTLDTLWLRLLGRRRTQEEAIGELLLSCRASKLQNDFCEALAASFLTRSAQRSLND